MTRHLKPCALCGCTKVPKLQGNGAGDNWLECFDCGMSTRLREDGAGSEKDWNRRPETAGSDARLATLERICAGITDEMIDGGWTALGLSKHAKNLEDRLAARDGQSAEQERSPARLSERERFIWNLGYSADKEGASESFEAFFDEGWKRGDCFEDSKPAMRRTWNAAIKFATQEASKCMHGKTYEEVGRVSWNNGIAEAIDAIRAALNAPASQSGEPREFRKETIREIFLANGFTVKEGQSDLKPYVYTAAEALLWRFGLSAKNRGYLSQVEQAAATLIAVGRLLSETGYSPELRILDAVREVIAKAENLGEEARDMADFIEEDGLANQFDRWKEMRAIAKGEGK